MKAPDDASFAPTRPIPERRDPADVRIRGSALLPTKAFVEREFGTCGWQRFLESLAPSHAVAFMELAAMREYPFAVAIAGADGVVELAGGRPEVLRRLALHNLDAATSTLFKVIFKVSSPDYMVARSNQVWRRYYSAGEMKAFVEPGVARVELHDFPYGSDNYDRVILHSVEAVLLKAGARVTSATQTKNTAFGAPYSEFRYTWR